MNFASSSIMDTITEIFRNLFSSIDNSIYPALDKIAFIDTNVIDSPYLEKIFGVNSVSGILLIANSLLVGFILYFTVRYLLSNFSIVEAQNPYNFFIKIIFIGIFMNSSYFICEQIINLNSLISSSIREVGHDFLSTDICFSNLINVLNSIVSLESEGHAFFSIDGIIKTIVSVGFLNLIFTFSIRYILIKVFILISPFAILCTSTPSTSSFFKSWLKSFISLLLTESFSSLILIVMLSLEYNPSDIVSKLLFVGSVFALMKANNYIKELLGGISLDVQNSLFALRGMSKIK